MIIDLLFLFIIHFIADFGLQTRKMGLNKGKSLMWLSMHVGVYLITLLIFGLIFGQHLLDSNDMYPIFKYCLLNGAIHWVTDFITSKGSGYSYVQMLKYESDNNDKKKYQWQYVFWLVIGFDQLLHIITLMLTYQYFFM